MTHNQRTARTVIQVLLAIASAVPLVVAHVPMGATGAELLVAASLFCRYFALVERLPGFPKWLKVEVPKQSHK